ncbi:MAG: MAPEG family protein [Pseudomonadota bacterium]
MTLMYLFLVGAVLLFLAMIMFHAVANSLNHGPVLLGPRDTLDKPDTVLAGRAKRAAANMMENMVMFAPLVIVAVEASRATPIAEFGAGLFLAARIVYAPAYWFAIPLVRPAAWFTGVVGLLMIASQLLVFARGA